SQYGRPRIGTVRFRKGTVFATVIDCVCGVIVPAVGVTTTEYGPSWTSGTLITPTKRPSVPELVVFVAMTADGERNSIVSWMPEIPLSLVESRTYPATPSAAPAPTVWPELGAPIATSPLGRGATSRARIASSVASCAGPPSL